MPVEQPPMPAAENETEQEENLEAKENEMYGLLIENELPDKIEEENDKITKEQRQEVQDVADQLNKVTQGLEDNKGVITSAVSEAMISLDNTAVMNLIRDSWDALPVFVQKTLIGQNFVGRAVERVTASMPFLAGVRVPGEVIKSAVEMGLLDVKEMPDAAEKIAAARIAEIENLKKVAKIIPGGAVVDPVLTTAENLIGTEAEVKREVREAVLTAREERQQTEELAEAA
jgi:hypothetical protein